MLYVYIHKKARLDDTVAKGLERFGVDPFASSQADSNTGWP